MAKWLEIWWSFLKRTINFIHMSYVNSLYPNEMGIKRTTKCSHLLWFCIHYWNWILKTNLRLNFITNGMFSISPSSTFLTSIAIFHFHCILCLYLADDFICKSLFDIRSVFQSSIDKQVDVTRVSTVSFTDNFLRSNLLIQPSSRPNAAWCVSCQSF
jgi:hypothetical protein